jgi:hypothetical protein
VRDDLAGGDDLQWRRPPEGAPAHDPPASASPPPPDYTGPPRTVPPPPDWRPRVLIQPPPPHQLPPQDLDALDAQEREERTITYGVGLVAGAILLVVLLILCGRAVF